MKWLITLLAVFVLALNWVPCSDAYNECGSTALLSHSTSDADQADPHQHSDDHDDSCSPFCTCACCGVSFTNLTFNVKPSIQEDLPEYFEKQFVARSISFQSSFFGNIWQPPKINA